MSYRLILSFFVRLDNKKLETGCFATKTENMRIFIRVVVYAGVVKVRDIACPFYHPAFCLEIPFGDAQAHLGFKYQK